MTTIMIKYIYHNFIGSEMASGIIDFKHDQFQRFKNASNQNHFKVKVDEEIILLFFYET